MTSNHDVIRFGFRHTRRNGADANFRDQLHADAGDWIHVLQVVDQLRQIFNRVNVVVRWW